MQAAKTGADLGSDTPEMWHMRPKNEEKKAKNHEKNAIFRLFYRVHNLCNLYIFCVKNKYKTNKKTFSKKYFVNIVCQTEYKLAIL